MCAIAFVWHRDPARDLIRRCRRMVDVQSHRGPDHARVIGGHRYAIGHARLRVMDPTARADMPLGDAHDGLLSYNGEVYDHASVRSVLRSDGERFETTGDAEVVHRAMVDRGLAGLELLRGMFAFVFFEPSRSRVTLVRDRVGIKPLHYALVDGGIVVASEAAGVLSSGLIDFELDAAAVHQTWRFNHLLGESTAFTNVRQVPVGCALRLDLETMSVTTHRYHRFLFHERSPERFCDRAEALDAAFVRAVRRQTVSDRPVGAYLSAGVDSSGIVAEASRHVPDLQTYTMTFTDGEHDEGPLARRFVEQANLDNVGVPIEAPSLQDLVRFVRASQMPQQWTSDLALMKLATHVRHPVVLTGEGPDELLAGYDAYRAMKIRKTFAWAKPERLSRVPFLRRLVLKGITPWLDLDLSAVDRYLAHHRADRSKVRRSSYGTDYEGTLMWDLLSACQRDLLGPAIADRTDALEDDEAAFFRNQVQPFVEGRTQLETNLYYEIAVRLPNWVLHMGDRMSAASGLELRFPYLDDDVVDICLGLRETDRLRGLTDKRILRHIHRRRLPAAVCRRPKRPLYAPMLPWLRGFATARGFERYWNRDVFAKTEMFDWDASQRLVHRLLTASFEDVVDRMTSEWAFMLVLTTNILDVEMREVACGIG